MRVQPPLSMLFIIRSYLKMCSREHGLRGKNNLFPRNLEINGGNSDNMDDSEMAGGGVEAQNHLSSS